MYADVIPAELGFRYAFHYTLEMELESILRLPPDQAAVQLLGSEILVHTPQGTAGGLITELEAYFSEGDAASHFARGKRASNASMFMGLGTLYIHPHRKHTLIDVITEHEGVPGALLFRAVEPTVGLDIMKIRRGITEDKRLCNGPGKLCAALGITQAHNGLNVLKNGSPIEIIPAHTSPEISGVHISKRIGITKNAEALLRFNIKNSAFVSR